MRATSKPKKSPTVKGAKGAKSRSAARTASSEKGAAGGRKPAAGRKAGAKRTEATALPGMITSKVTDRSQTTLPPGVRQVLGIKGGQRLGYVFDSEGVRLINASRATEHEDPGLQRFLVLLGRHVASGPVAGGAVAFPSELLDRARAVAADVEIDHDAPVAGAIAL
jgi:hypothetical protein